MEQPGTIYNSPTYEETQDTTSEDCDSESNVHLYNQWSY